ncbi:hypothetical protein QYE76_025187 [Lolium multiflorum]|uniref:Uncharacterized protein n=1 Tax=Lolium multiflorum TaxID=4521 RepID=A0AAD8VWF3_LOLMU|nr:hypothetical protein QYE76_025187 [Lolium multiflorum]
MENYSLLMGDNSVDEDGGGVDGGAFGSTSPSGGVRAETHVPGSWLRDGSGSGRPRTASPKAERRGTCRKRALDSFDPGSYVFWKDAKMGKTHICASWPIHEHVPPLRAEAGSEFVDKLMAQGQKNKQPASGSGPATPSKRFRTEPLGEKQVGVRRYGRKHMPTASGPALKLAQGHRALKVPQGLQPLLCQARLSGAGNPLPPFRGTTSSGRAAPSSSDHRTEEDLSFLESQDTGTSQSVWRKKLPGGAGLGSSIHEKRQLPRRNLPRRKVPTG